MSSQPPGYQHITPPSSFRDAPLTPPPTDEKGYTQALRVIALFKDIRAGRHIKRYPWTEFRLSKEDYDEVERQLSRDESLLGYVKDKIRFDYDRESRRMIVRMPSGVHELFIDGVEDAIRSQLKEIRSGSDRAALFARKVRPARGTEISFPAGDIPKSKYEPDTSFWHDNARYPGVVIEVAYSQKRKRLNRLAENYLLDSDASIQVVVGLDIEYGQKGSRKATLSMWRTSIAKTLAEDELIVFRDEQGNPTRHPGLRLQLRDFAYEELAEDEIGEEKRELVVSTQELCQYLAAAETKVQQLSSLGKHSIAPGVKKRKRSETPPDQITSGDEARYIEQEERTAKRVEGDDSDYEDTSIKSLSE
ncbi:hypothetical protein FQN54_008790 [Arachnomyces sp. PD_36]|nr:hypothetical protein FQN54_008790 [Arachnomyces sp. PD_36]